MNRSNSDFHTFHPVVILINFLTNVLCLLNNVRSIPLHFLTHMVTWWGMNSLETSLRLLQISWIYFSVPLNWKTLTKPQWTSFEKLQILRIFKVFFIYLLFVGIYKCVYMCVYHSVAINIRGQPVWACFLLSHCGS